LIRTEAITGGPLERFDHADCEPVTKRIGPCRALRWRQAPVRITHCERSVAGTCQPPRPPDCIMGGKRSDRLLPDGCGRLYRELQGLVETGNDLQSRRLGFGTSGLVDCTQGCGCGLEPDNRIPAPCKHPCGREVECPRGIFHNRFSTAGARPDGAGLVRGNLKFVTSCKILRRRPVQCPQHTHPVIHTAFVPQRRPTRQAAPDARIHADSTVESRFLPECLMRQYLDLMSHVLEPGDHKTDRTGTGTLSVFG